MQPLDADQQEHVDKLIGEARVKARKLAKEEAKAAAGALGEEAQEASILKRVAEAVTTAKEEAKTEFEAEAAKAVTKAEEDAVTAKLVEEKKWEDLATQHSTKVETLIAELEPLKAKVTAYEALVADMLDSALETLGDAAVKAVEALPGEPAALEKLVWLHQNEELFGQDDSKTGAVGSPSRRAKVTKAVSKDGKEPAATKRISRWVLKL